MVNFGNFARVEELEDEVIWTNRSAKNNFSINQWEGRKF